MFDIGFSEVLLIFVIALVVLGPEKLPRVAAQVGRWIGRARSMARQFREQLEEEVNLEQVRKAHEKTKTQTQSDSEQGAPPTSGESAAGSGATGAAGAVDTASNTTVAGDASSGSSDEHGAQQLADTSSASAATYRGPDPADFRADTFSHAHPTNAYGANPYTSNGAAEDPPPPTTAHTTPAESSPPSGVVEGSSQTLSEANVAAAQPQSESNAEGHAASGEAYAASKLRDNTPGTDNHGN
jgi:sec-independent protein translocase protein TatB